jgi:uncharacterized protein (TIGR03382 family)
MAGPGLAESRPMLRRALLLLLLVPGFALAQTGSVTAFATSQGVIGQANRADCASTTSTATWAITTTGITLATGDKWRLQTSSGACSSTVPTTGYLTEVLATSTTQSITGVFVQQMGTEAGVSCTGANDQTINLCVYYLPGGTIPSNPLVFTGTFNFQTAIPPAPNLNSSSPGDGQLSINVTSGTGTSTETAVTGLTFTITCTPPAGGTASTATGNAGNIVCSGLTNGTAYTVTGVATSPAGNVGAVSAPLGPSDATTPLPFVDFWNVYKTSNGVEAGGCGTGGAGAFAPTLALLGLLLARRRRS